MLALFVGLLTIASLSVPAMASAAPLSPFTKLCVSGTAAGECHLPRGVAASPTNGHIYLADQENHRVDEFTAWGEFVGAWGWGVDDGSSEFQRCNTQSGCQEGIPGEGADQFAAILGAAVDSAGDVYVIDWALHRVQKFDSEGNFLLMFGGGVDPGPNHPGDVCTAAYIEEGDTCGAGSIGTEPGEFGSLGVGNLIAIGPNDEVYVGDQNRIQVFDVNGIYQDELPIPQPGSVSGLAVDPNSGDLYMHYPNGRSAVESTLSNVYRLDETTGAVIDTLENDRPAAVTVDPLGNVYVFDQNFIFGGNASDPKSHGTRLLVYDDTGELIEKALEGNGSEEIQYSTGFATGSACFSGEEFGFYLSSFDPDYVQAFGPNPDPTKCAPPDVPPEIAGQFAASVGPDSATLQAEINPRYFTPPVGTTTYFVEWGTAECVEDQGWAAECVDTIPVPPGNALTTPPGNEAVTSGGIVLNGLSPGTAYRYRFVAEREREAGGIWVVVGEGGEPGNDGAEAEFTTMPLPTLPEVCPNDSFRSGLAAALRDCRAYELVSPLDKAGGDVQPRLNIVPFEARVDQASTSGDGLAFSAYRAFEDPASAPFSSQYLARRDSSLGWQTEAISPPQEGEAFITPLLAIDNLFRAFSPDLGTAWLFTDTEPILGAGGLPRQPNIYRRDNTSNTYEGCTTAKPFFPGDEAHGPQLQGFSGDNHIAVFRTENKLTEEASEKESESDLRIYQVYACSYEGGVAKLTLVSVLPDGSTSERNNSVGGPANESFQLDQGRTESLENAVSADGTKVFWTASENDDARTPGALYVRLNPAAERTASGECDESEPDKACTRLISAGPARFWTAADDGSIAIFTSSTGQLNEFEVATDETRPIAPQVIGVLGANEDASRVYFLSRAQIGGEGAAGKPNLYLHDRIAESTTFVATLSEQDAAQDKTNPGPANPEPAYHTARVTPDGSVVAFMSNDAQLAEDVAGYDNTDQAGHRPAAEIYRYAVGGGLVCVSCQRTGQRPQGREIQNKIVANSPVLFAASRLQPWRDSLYAPRVLSEDGNRIFFDAFEPLVSADTNETSDVYQWEALGTGTCVEKDSAFDLKTAGCVSLLTSGKSSDDSQFVDASPFGNDVFVRTASSLVSWDPGQIDLYDVRVGGGFSAPPTPPSECKGESCQPVTPAPEKPTPASSGPSTGNVHQKAAKPKRCPKGKHKVKRKGKVRCVKDKKSHKKGKAGTTRRAGR